MVYDTKQLYFLLNSSIPLYTIISQEPNIDDAGAQLIALSLTLNIIFHRERNWRCWCSINCRGTQDQSIHHQHRFKWYDTKQLYFLLNSSITVYAIISQGPKLIMLCTFAHTFLQYLTINKFDPNIISNNSVILLNSLPSLTLNAIFHR